MKFKTIFSTFLQDDKELKANFFTIANKLQSTESLVSLSSDEQASKIFSKKVLTLLGSSDRHYGVILLKIWLEKDEGCVPHIGKSALHLLMNILNSKEEEGNLVKDSMSTICHLLYLIKLNHSDIMKELHLNYLQKLLAIFLSSKDLETAFGCIAFFCKYFPFACTASQGKIQELCWNVIEDCDSEHLHSAVTALIILRCEVGSKNSLSGQYSEFMNQIVYKAEHLFLQFCKSFNFEYRTDIPDAVTSENSIALVKKYDRICYLLRQFLKYSPSFGINLSFGKLFNMCSHAFMLHENIGKSSLCSSVDYKRALIFIPDVQKSTSWLLSTLIQRFSALLTSEWKVLEDIVNQNPELLDEEEFLALVLVLINKSSSVFFTNISATLNAEISKQFPSLKSQRLLLELLKSHSYDLPTAQRYQYEKLLIVHFLNLENQGKRCDDPTLYECLSLLMISSSFIHSEFLTLSIRIIRNGLLNPNVSAVCLSTLQQLDTLLQPRKNVKLSTKFLTKGREELIKNEVKVADSLSLEVEEQKLKETLEPEATIAMPEVQVVEKKRVADIPIIENNVKRLKTTNEFAKEMEMEDAIEVVIDLKAEVKTLEKATTVETLEKATVETLDNSEENIVKVDQEKLYCSKEAPSAEDESHESDDELIELVDEDPDTSDAE